MNIHEAKNKAAQEFGRKDFHEAKNFETWQKMEKIYDRAMEIFATYHFKYGYNVALHDASKVKYLTDFARTKIIDLLKIN